MYDVKYSFSPVYILNQGWAVVPEFGGIPVPRIPGIGAGTGAQSHGTVGTGTKICGTVPLLKSLETRNPGISLSPGTVPLSRDSTGR